MYLVEDKAKTAEANVDDCSRAQTRGPVAPPLRAGGKWQNFPNSVISHHGAACCDLAHEWLIAFDFAQLNGGDVMTGPRWLREHSKWGPSAWPIHWCEAVDAEVVDCGAHAAMAHEAFIARGVPAFRAQFIQRYSADSAMSWRHNWAEQGVSDHWLDGETIYHEGNAVLVGTDTIKLWDGSAGWWINPRGEAGYGSLQAVRIESAGCSLPDDLHWGERRIKPNEWVAL